MPHSSLEQVVGQSNGITDTRGSARAWLRAVSGRVMDADWPSRQHELPNADPTPKGVPMGVGHRQEANGGIVEQQARRIANDFCADPERLRLAREGELNLQLVATAVAQDRQGIEEQSLLADAGHKRGQDLIVSDQLRIERDRNQSLTMRAKQHRSRSYGEPPDRAKNLPDPPRYQGGMIPRCLALPSPLPHTS